MLAGFIRPVSHLLLKCGKGGFHLSESLLSGAQLFLHMFSNSGHRFMHVIQTGVIAGLFAAKNGFHLFGQGGEHGFRQVFKFQLNRRCY